MSMEWIKGARERYIAANALGLRWMLDRPLLDGRWINTKVNSITMADYGPQDGLRGPGYIYGWIQGRALEAMVTHSRAFAGIDDALSQRLEAAARALYAELAAEQARDGHVYFCYGADRMPILPDGTPQCAAGDIYSYSDAFAAKGLVAAAAAFRLPGLDGHLDYLQRVVAAIPAERFQMNEKAPLGDAALSAQAADFGPRMILLGAGEMLQRFGLDAHGDYLTVFTQHILEHHADRASGLIRDVPESDACNIGHGIEFVGFALAALPPTTPSHLVERLEAILQASFRAGLRLPGLVLSVSAASGAVLDAKRPWWSLPETIRAAALAYERTGNPATLTIWRQADTAFFGNYWRADRGLAHQTMTACGPLDFVPATPDLDPGYHTGLSLLAAIRVADRLTA